MAKNCRGCYYFKPLCSSSDFKVCHYSIITDELRGCPSSECDKKLVLTRAQARKKDLEYKKKRLKETMLGR